jgi:hypothetical protein
MALAKYNTREYRAARKAITAAQRRGEWLVCVQPECVEASRAIAPSQPADVAHDDSGTVVLGPAHQSCNRVDGGKRRHLATTPRRWIL